MIYKMCSWSNLKLEGWSAAASQGDDDLPPTQLRLIAGETKLRVALKRRLADCARLHTRVAVQFGDVMWILSQSQLRAASKLAQSLMNAGVESAKTERRKPPPRSQTLKPSTLPGQTSEHRRLKGLSVKEKAYHAKMVEYQEGRRNLPSYEVIQDSFHLQTGKLNLQLCDDTSIGSGGSTVEGSMKIELSDVGVDVYFDQQAGAGRCHWNKANDIILRNTKWSRKLMERASKTQHMDLPSVSLSNLREKGIVVRCSDFSVGALRSGKMEKGLLPVMTCDKKTFNIPEDMHNPAFQVGVTIYQYPIECGNRFLGKC